MIKITVDNPPTAKNVRSATVTRRVYRQSIKVYIDIYFVFWSFRVGTMLRLTRLAGTWQAGRWRHIRWRDAFARKTWRWGWRVDWPACPPWSLRLEPALHRAHRCPSASRRTPDRQRSHIRRQQPAEGPSSLLARAGNNRLESIPYGESKTNGVQSSRIRILRFFQIPKKHDFLRFFLKWRIKSRKNL